MMGVSRCTFTAVREEMEDTQMENNHADKPQLKSWLFP